MSRRSKHRIECPECGKSQETIVWDSINVDLDANLRDRLFASEINQFRCPSCGHEALLSTPLLYHDTTRQFCVQYFPPESLGAPERAFQEYDAAGRLDIGLPVEKKEGRYLTAPHVVFDMNEMIRYILFREFLHSRDKEG